ncbi:hypothetical protein D3C84_1090680 [compost metagenome]
MSQLFGDFEPGDSISFAVEFSQRATSDWGCLSRIGLIAILSVFMPEAIDGDTGHFLGEPDFS